MREKSQCVSISGPRISGQEILHYANIYYRYGICGSGEFLLTGNIMSAQVCMGLTTRNCKRLFLLSDSNSPYIHHRKTFMQQQTWGRRFTQRADHLTHAQTGARTLERSSCLHTIRQLEPIFRDAIVACVDS